MCQFYKSCTLKIINLIRPNSRPDEFEHAMADDTDGNVVVEDVITFLGWSLGSEDKLLYVFCLSGLAEYLF